jgi:prepilin-type N-terminal cleavage/methylation domain-containing protein
MSRTAQQPRAQDGFTLVEVMMAVALLGSVMISLSGLFVLGIHQLKSGRAQSTALSVGRDIMEEMQGWHFEHLYAAYGEDGSATAYVIDTRTHSFAAPWQAVLADGLAPGAYAEIEIESVSDTGPPPALDAATCIRVSVTVYWTEDLRERRLSLATTRM